MCVSAREREGGVLLCMHNIMSCFYIYYFVIFFFDFTVIAKPSVYQ